MEVATRTATTSIATTAGATATTGGPAAAGEPAAAGKPSVTAAAASGSGVAAASSASRGAAAPSTVAHPSSSVATIAGDAIDAGVGAIAPLSLLAFANAGVLLFDDANGGKDPTGAKAKPQLPNAAGVQAGCVCVTEGSDGSAHARTKSNTAEIRQRLLSGGKTQKAGKR